MVSCRQISSSLVAAAVVGVALVAAQDQVPDQEGFVPEQAMTGSMAPTGAMVGTMDDMTGTMAPTGAVVGAMDTMTGSMAPTNAVVGTMDDTATEAPVAVPIGPSCAVYPMCTDLEGNCCPSDEGEMLGCCMGITAEGTPVPMTDDDGTDGTDGAMTTGDVGGGDLDTPVVISAPEDLDVMSNETETFEPLEPTIAPTTTFKPTTYSPTMKPTNTFRPTAMGTTYAPTIMPVAPFWVDPNRPVPAATDTEASLSSPPSAAEVGADATEAPVVTDAEGAVDTTEDSAIAAPSSAATVSTAIATFLGVVGGLMLLR